MINTKNLSLVLLTGLVFILLITACKKKEKNTISNTFDVGTTTASNPSGILPPATPPCTPAVNTAKFTSSYILPNLAFYSVLSDKNGYDNYEINGNASNGDCSIGFSFDHAPESGVYKIASPSAFNSTNEVTLTFTMLSSYFVASSGSMYITNTNGKIEATYCNIPCSGPSSSVTFTASGNVKIN